MQATGRFNDGRTAASRTVSITLETNRLAIVEQEGPGRWFWPLDDLRRVGEERRGGALMLSLAEEPGSERLGDARLVVAEGQAEFRAALLEAAPQLKGARLRRRAIWRPAALTLVVALGLVAFVLYGLRPAARALATVVPVSWEVAIGDTAFAQIIDYFSIFKEEPLKACVAQPGQALIEDLTRSLAAQTDGTYDYRVMVLDHPMINAFALPGGRIVIFRGLIDFAGRPEEVSAVLSHEMAHVIAQHGVGRIMEQFGLAILLDFITGGGGVITGGAALALSLSYSRDDEREADRLGIALLNDAGLNSDGLATFFERLSEEGEAVEIPGPIGDLLSTHPGGDERIAAGRAAARDGRPVFTDEEWGAVQGICGETQPVAVEG